MMNRAFVAGARPPRILVVDDERQNRDLLQVMLAPEGFVVQAAASGEEALSMLERDPPDLVLLDVMMPGMNGYQMTSRIKASPAGKNIPVILVTALHDRGARMLGLDAGAEEFLTKPVDRAELCARVRNLLRLKAYGDHHDQYGQMLEGEVTSRTAQLVASERLYRSTFDAAPVGIAHVALDGRWLQVNERLCQLVGYTREQLVGGDAPDLLDAADQESEREALGAMAARTRHEYVVEERRYRRQDGGLVWARVNGSVHRDASGAALHCILVIADISERKASEEALRLSQARLLRLWDSGLILITITDDLGNIRDINPAGATMLGYSPAELLQGGVSWRSMTPPEWLATDRVAAEELVAKGVATPWEKELFHKDGSRVAILCGAAALDGAQRIAVAIDVTEKKRAQIDLLERAKVAAMSAEVGVALAMSGTLDDILQQCAEAMLAHLGATLVQLWMPDARGDGHVLRAGAGAVPGVGAPGDDASFANFDIAALAEGRQARFTQNIAEDAQGAQATWARQVGATAFAGLPLLVADKAVGVLAVFASHPLSELAVKALRSLADVVAIGVQRKVAEAGSLVLEAQLRQAQKMEAVGRLAGGVAHDFNNLLSIVLSYAELLAADLQAEDPMRADLDEIRGAGMRAVALTRQLLAFSRQQVLKPRVVDVSKAVDGMQKMLGRLIGEDIELVAICAPDSGDVLVDPSQIEQVILNLVVNARDAMPRGGTLTIETGAVDLDAAFAAEHVGVVAGTHVMLAVSDDGAGMDEATLARMYEPFFTTKDASKGTGLGLATVFGIVQQSGGTIWATSAPGMGTTFRIYFPVIDAAPPWASLPPPPERLVLRGSETILLVEDEEAVRHLARTILRKYGYTVLEAQSGGDALLLCEQHDAAIDLLLTDVVMPRMSGRELAERLRPLRPQMKVLYMSGYTDDTVVRHGILDATLAFLQKPITPALLAMKVREALDRVTIAAS